MQYGVQQRLVNFYFAVVIDEAQFAEFVHEEADAGPRRPNHFRKGLLTENERSDGRVAFLPIVRKKQQQASKPLLARIEQLIDYVLMREPHVAQAVVVLVERKAVESQRDAAAA